MKKEARGINKLKITCMTYQTFVENAGKNSKTTIKKSFNNSLCVVKCANDYR